MNEVPELMDVAAVAAYTGLAEPTIRRKLAGDRKSMPPPDYRVGMRAGDGPVVPGRGRNPGRPVWERTTIETWNQARRMRDQVDEGRTMDLHEVSRVLRQRESKVREMVEAGTFPRPNGEQGGKPVWLAYMVYRWLGAHPPKVPVTPRVLLDSVAVAQMVGVSYATINAYRARGNMPQADWFLGGVPVWRPETIEAWIAARPGSKGRRPRAPRQPRLPREPGFDAEAARDAAMEVLIAEAERTKGGAHVE